MSKGSTVSNTAMDPQQMAMYQDLYDRSKSIANQPFVPYTGARVAGYNPDQLAGMDATRGLFNQSQRYNPQQGLQTLLSKSLRTPTVTPFRGSATDINRSNIRDVRPQSLLSTDLSAYQNPFQSQVIDNTIGDLNRARQMQIQSDQDAAIGRGAFGGSRSAILESETNRNFADSVAKASGNLRSQGFDRATSLAGQDIGRQTDADRYMSGIDQAVELGNAGYGNQFGMANMDAINRARFMQPQMEMQNRQFQQNLLNDQVQNQYQNLGLLGNQGRSAQALSQAGMDAGYEQFQRAINYGPQQLGLLAQGLGGLPANSSTTQSRETGAGDVLGTAAQLYGMYLLGSDERMKKDITFVGKEKGHNIYTWNWKDEAKEIGWDKFPTTGVLAQEVKKYMPEAVTKHANGYYMVNYGVL